MELKDSRRLDDNTESYGILARNIVKTGGCSRFRIVGRYVGVTQDRFG
jgi:hypothetical protein